MPSLVQDLAFLSAGVEQLEDYLLSDVIYWPLHEADLPHLTLGGLLLAERRATVRARDGAERARLEALRMQMEAVRLRWRAAWERKCSQEVRARLALWQSFLQDYREAPAVQAENYPQQVQWRVLLQLLTETLENAPKEAGVVLELDRFLRAVFLPGKFIWEEDLSPAFPPEPFWFLYGNLKA